MIYVAQLNEEHIAFGLSQLGEKAQLTTDMVQLQGWDESVLGKQWDGDAWREIEPPEPPQDKDMPEEVKPYASMVLDLQKQLHDFQAIYDKPQLDRIEHMLTTLLERGE